MLDETSIVRRRVLTAQDIQDLSETHRLGEVRCSGWCAHDRDVTERLIV